MGLIIPGYALVNIFQISNLILKNSNFVLTYQSLLNVFVKIWGAFPRDFFRNFYNTYIQS